MDATILSIGAELTRGELVNTNANWLAEQLTELGFDVCEQVVVDDRADRIAETLRRLGGRKTVVVSTGGLGPTSDDRTSEAAALAMGVSLLRDEATVRLLERKWTQIGRPMPVSNLKQADFPSGATIIPNSVGTAPAFGCAVGESTFFFLPGVPREMKHLFHAGVVPEIADLTTRDSHQIHLRSFGLTESEIADRLKDLEPAHSGLTLAYRAHFPEIEIKVLVRAEDESMARTKAKEVAEIVTERLEGAVFGDRDASYAGAVGRSLRDRGMTVAIAESCTGGMIGAMITSVPGSSDYLLLGVVAYSNAAKTSLLGVSEETLRGHGAVSEETAAAMAEGALRVSGADVAVAVTGIAGPGGGTEERPVGTVWFGFAKKGEPTFTKMHRLRGSRERIRTLSAYIALRMVKRATRR